MGDVDWGAAVVAAQVEAKPHDDPVEGLNGACGGDGEMEIGGLAKSD